VVRVGGSAWSTVEVGDGAWVKAIILKVILLADSIRSRLLAWFGSPIIKKIFEYHPPNVYGYAEI
jgi:hypothetical protein